MLIPLTLALLYSIGSNRMKSLIGVRRLKEKLLVKNLAISLGWSLIPMLVGLYYQGIPIILLAFAPFIFLRLLSNTVFFDLRDVSADKEFGVRTIPVVYGAKRAFVLMTLFDFASAIYVMLLVGVGLYPTFSLVLLALPIYSMIYRELSKRPNADLDFLCDIVADGEYLMWGPLIFVASIIL